jgi:hypothetical protein
MKGREAMKRIFLLCAFGMMIIGLFMAHGAYAIELAVGDKPLTIQGYITQGAQFGFTGKDRYDSPSDLQAALTNVFMEVTYTPRNDLKFYGSGMFTMDWVYDIKDHNTEWNRKGFDKSRKEGLYMDNEYWQLLKEAHVTWSPPNWNFRVGKQTVSWGEMLGWRLMDQINPLDTRRGMADVEFETTIIPIWLVKAEYFVQNKPSWIQDLGLEAVFNPNVTFIRNQLIMGGNEYSGIWSPDIDYGFLPTPPFPPNTLLRAGHASTILDKPNAFSSEGFEYGFRVKAMVQDSVITLNYYYGLDKNPVGRVVGTPISPCADGSCWQMNPMIKGYYPLFRFAGATFSREFSSLKASALGNVAPLLRLEGFYGFSNTWMTQRNDLETHDEIRWAASVDWKIKVDWLNPRAYFSIAPQFMQQHILSYPSDYALSNPGGKVYENTYTSVLNISTTYLHNKLQPSFFWMRDLTNKSDLFRYQVAYEYSNNWKFTAGAIKIYGTKAGAGLEPMHNKDNIYLKLSYKWG